MQQRQPAATAPKTLATHSFSFDVVVVDQWVVVSQVN